MFYVEVPGGQAVDVFISYILSACLTYKKYSILIF